MMYKCITVMMKLLFYKPSDMEFQLTLTECLGFNEANCEITKQHLRLVESTYPLVI